MSCHAKAPRGSKKRARQITKMQKARKLRNLARQAAEMLS